MQKMLAYQFGETFWWQDIDSRQILTFFLVFFCLSSLLAKDSNLLDEGKCYSWCNCTSECWGNGECNPFLNDKDHCDDGGDCSWEFLGCEISELKMPKWFGSRYKIIPELK